MVSIEEVVKNKDYDFLRTNEHLGRNIIFLTLGGSHAYGTNIETSDIDIRGCAVPRKNEIIGLSNFEQVLDKNTDTTIYSFNKLVNLMLNCNPNTIEMLGCKQYYMVNSIGQDLIDNRKMFLSRRAVNSFGGYATAQLRRLQNAVARDRLTQSDREVHIMNSVKSAMFDFDRKYTNFGDGYIRLSIDKSNKEELENEIFVDVDLKHYPLRDYKSIVSEMNNVVRDYEKLNHRNNKKDNLHLNKHAMHLIRLYLMAIDIFEKEEIITYRENDLDLLMSIRNGKYMNDDGTYQQEFFDMVTCFEKRLKYAMENSSLPQNPNYKKIEEFVVDVNRRVINDEY